MMICYKTKVTKFSCDAKNAQICNLSASKFSNRLRPGSARTRCGAYSAPQTLTGGCFEAGNGEGQESGRKGVGTGREN